LAQNSPLYCEHDPEDVLAKLQEKYQKTVAQLALNWILRKAGVVVIPKASSAEHVREDCGGSGWSLSKADCAMLSEKILYRSRGTLEKIIRRCGKRVVQTFGKEL
jgi:diketogulonate reductase-like aldo/keto reductase